MCKIKDCFNCPYEDCISEETSTEHRRRLWRESYYRNKDQRLAYAKTYRQRPEVKARNNERNKLRRKRLKELNETNRLCLS